jgi:hypothetical protein
MSSTDLILVASGFCLGAATLGGALMLFTAVRRARIRRLNRMINERAGTLLHIHRI